jgi:hypothetical protein
LMKYSLSSPITAWKKDSVYDILRQVIILDCNF